MIVSSSGSNECFTKTQSLDGETNLKPKLPIKEINKAFIETKMDDLSKVKFSGGIPDADLYGFRGTVSFADG